MKIIWIAGIGRSMTAVISCKDGVEENSNRRVDKLRR